MGQQAEHPTIAAYHGVRCPPAPVPAPRWREWMNATLERTANRCLPLLVANEHGWVLPNPVGFRATWNGDDVASGVTIEFEDDGLPAWKPVQSHFGYGVVTWNVGYLFRTPPGYNLLVRGPANWPKDGVCALEGLVETDWTTATFTMNWKLTRRGHTVRFEKGEPYCMIVPQRRGELESFRPELRDIRSDPDLRERHGRWEEAREDIAKKKFLSQYSKEFADSFNAWQRHYFRGVDVDETPAPEHQTKLRLAAFADGPE